MDNQPQVKISIPELCHEDWNKMTPNEKGAFCSKCCKTVVDFTQKSPEEIRNILLKDTSKKMCGRFMSNQLDEPAPEVVNLTIPLHLLPKPVSPIRRFAIALFIAFGTTLFSCGTYNNTTVGEVQIDSSTAVSDTAEAAINTVPAGIEIEKMQTKTGEVMAVPVKGDISIEPIKNTGASQDTLKKVKPIHEMRGRVSVIPISETHPDTTAQQLPKTVPVQKMGKVKISDK